MALSLCEGLKGSLNAQVPLASTWKDTQGEVDCGGRGRDTVLVPGGVSLLASSMPVCPGEACPLPLGRSSQDPFPTA